MRLEFLYRVRFKYPESWAVAVGAETQHFFLAEGRCEGRLTGTFRGANHPRRRGDGTFLPDFQGVITTNDGAVVYFDYQGYGRAYPPGRRQIVSAATHLTADPRYLFLNDAIAVGEGEVLSLPDGSMDLVVEWNEVIWEPAGE
jgi:hypothetical protein